MKLLVQCITILSIAMLPAKEPAAQPPPQNQVWFTPNVGSVDMLNLFNNPEQWTSARSQIDVFKFYMGQVSSAGWSCIVNPSSNCGTNHLQNLINSQAFVKLGQWGIDIAVESFFAGPVMADNPIICSSSQYIYSLTLDGSLNAIQNVQANGGTVRYLAMDEPIRRWYRTFFHIYSGQTDPRPCLVDSLGILADDMAAYLKQMKLSFPSVSIGQIDLYPEVGVAQFKEWIHALEARGVSLAFLHIDVNGPRVDQYISWGININVAADMAELKSFLEVRGIAFGIIFTDTYWNSQFWEPSAYTDSTYYSGAMNWVNFVQTANLAPHHSIFQSWVFPFYTTGTGANQIPVNLPEADPAVYSHTRLINEALGVVVDVDEDPPPETPVSFALYQNHPNPFNPTTSIDYDLQRSSRVSLMVYDTLGRAVQTLVSNDQEAGTYSVSFKANDLPTGIYFYQLRVGDDLVETKKMLVMK